MAPSSNKKKPAAAAAAAAKKSGDNTKPKDKGKASTTASTSGNGKDDNAGPSKLKAATAINARHILCEKHSKKEEALSKLHSGARFDDVAREYSEDKARQGGSLGWKVRGSLDAGFEKAAYGLGVSDVGRPEWVEVKSGFGYHLVMVEGRR